MPEEGNSAGKRHSKILFFLRFMGAELEDLFYPRRCPICREILTDRHAKICSRCAGRLPVVREPKCMICSRPISDERSMLCPACRQKKHRYIRGDCTFVYSGELRDALMRFKFNNCREYADFFAEAVSIHARPLIHDVKPRTLIPIPMNKKKRKERGYDQCLLIGEKISEYTGIPMLSGCLVRVRYTRPQKGLDAGERRENLRGSMRVLHPEKIREPVLLFDDIYTTGTTMDEAAGVLRECGIRQIYFICVCTVPAS